MNNKIELLSQWGCDTKGTMERMLGDENFYIKCLGILLDDSSFELLQQAIENGNAVEAFRYAHTLKGVSANVGITPICDKVSELIEPLRNGHCENLLPKAQELIELRNHLALLIKD